MILYWLLPVQNHIVPVAVGLNRDRPWGSRAASDTRDARYRFSWLSREKSRIHVTWVRLFGRDRPGDWTDRVLCACRRHLIRRTSPTGPARPARPAPAAAPNHVDVAATLLQPPRCHIDVVTRGPQTARMGTTRTTGTACPRS